MQCMSLPIFRRCGVGWLGALAVLALAGCGPTPPLYAPFGTHGGYGFSEEPMPPHRFRVSYAAPLDVALAPHFQRDIDARVALAYDLALRRAAELARDNGAGWFVIVKRENDIERSEDGDLYGPFDTFGYPRRRSFLPAYPESRLGVVVTLTVELRDRGDPDTLEVDKVLAEVAQRRPGITCPDQRCE